MPFIHSLMQFLAPLNIFEGFRHAVICLFSVVFLMDLYSYDMKVNWNIQSFLTKYQEVSSNWQSQYLNSRNVTFTCNFSYKHDTSWWIAAFVMQFYFAHGMQFTTEKPEEGFLQMTFFARIRKLLPWKFVIFRHLLLFLLCWPQRDNNMWIVI